MPPPHLYTHPLIPLNGQFTPWLYALGYSLCYGTILVKMVRVYHILHKPTEKKYVSIMNKTWTEWHAI